MSDPVSEGRILALRGGDRASIQALLADAARRWAAAGVRVLGVVEVVPDPAVPDDIRLLDLVSGAQHQLNQQLGPGAAGCSLDPAGLAAACAGVEAAVSALVADGGIDGRAVVILSKFGRQEAEGTGLTHAFHAAVAADLPVLTSVSPVVAAAWEAFAGPLARYAPAQDAAIDAFAFDVLDMAAFGDRVQLAVGSKDRRFA